MATTYQIIIKRRGKQIEFTRFASGATDAERQIQPELKPGDEIIDICRKGSEDYSYDDH
jgi:hypothetical protein